MQDFHSSDSQQKKKKKKKGTFKKKNETILFCKKEIFLNLSENLNFTIDSLKNFLNMTTLSDQQEQEQQNIILDEIYNRIVAESFLVVGYIIGIFSMFFL